VRGGYVWVSVMALLALSSFWIHTIRLWGPWSPIHILSVVTLILLPIGVLHARAHRNQAASRDHDRSFAGALVIAGIFTFLPGRIMHNVLFGTSEDRPSAPTGGLLNRSGGSLLARLPVCGAAAPDRG